MKYFIMILFSFQIAACQNSQSVQFFIGTYTDGESEGIYTSTLHTDGTFDSVQLVAKTENPSFLDISDDGQMMFVVNELEQGKVESYKIDKNKLELLSQQSSGGAHPCFVTSDKNGHVLLANYTGGNVGLYQVDESGVLYENFYTQQHEGSGNHARQDAPHAHSIWVVEEGEQAIAVDLGTNELLFYTIDNGRLIPNKNQLKLQMATGAGPRHLAIHPHHNNRMYVLNELDCTVTIIEKDDAGVFQLKQTISSLPLHFNGFNTCADIHLSNDGRFLYASNRGHNSIAIYSVDSDNGHLSLIGFESVRGDSPRNFAITTDDRYLVVANQHTNNIISFKRNQTDGTLHFIDEIEAPTPVCIKFIH